LTCTTYSQDFEVAAFPILIAPFHGSPVPIKIRELTQAQILACGDFSLIETLEDKVISKHKKANIRDIIAYAERNHEVVKMSLVSPTYEQIFKIIGVKHNIKEAKKTLKELKEKLKQTKQSPQRSKLENEIDKLRIWYDLILPNDFMSFVVSYALGINKSDIKAVSEKMLLDAAILATRGNDNPADHIQGKFTPFMKDDINRRAWYFLDKFRKENKK
jgi:hypothetical protein